MKELNQNEIQSVSGGCGPGMFDGLAEAIFIMAGATAAVTFVVGVAMGVGASYIYSYSASEHD